MIDAHVHVWTANTRRYPLAPGFTSQDFSYPSFSAEELAAIARPSGVTRWNLVQMTWYGLDHSYIADTIAADPRHFVGTGIVPAICDVALPGPDQTMRALAQQGIVAFRLRGRSTRPLLGDEEAWMAHPGYERIFAAAEAHDLGLSFLLSPPDLPELDRMCGLFPGAPVIIDHLGLVGRSGAADEVLEALCRLARHPRVMVKVGAFYALGARTPPYLDLLPLVRRVAAAFGPERCMWESDSPHQAKAPHSYEAAVALIRDRATFLSPDDREQILTRTAGDFFFDRQRAL
ncbi:MAG: amidohydrolase family protein [Candidatus Handelsmanbacteria bacterium]|nr:amidohydrolase family protein [Candidatus Handelsmanbacteria bacterium]